MGIIVGVAFMICLHTHHDTSAYWNTSNGMCYSLFSEWNQLEYLQCPFFLFAIAAAARKQKQKQQQQQRHCSVFLLVSFLKWINNNINIIIMHITMGSTLKEKKKYLA